VSVSFTPGFSPVIPRTETGRKPFQRFLVERLAKIELCEAIVVRERKGNR
jgi:hypothetical protein